jgi:hypothetical protein
MSKLGLVLFVGSFISLVMTGQTQAGRGGNYIIEGDGDLQLEFEGHNSPKDSVSGEISSDRQMEMGVARYELTISEWTTSVAQQCKRGVVRLHYHVTGPIYKDRKTGQVANPNAQALMALGGLLANQEGIEDTRTFNERNYSASGDTLKIKGSVSAPNCSNSPNINLVPMCGVTWDSAAVIECHD